MKSERAHPSEMLTSAYLDETLDPQGIEKFEHHLARCADCRAGVVALKNLQVEGDPVPEEWLARARGTAGLRRGRSIWAAAAAIAAVVAIVVYVGGFGGKGSPVPEQPRVYRAGSDVLEALAPAAGARVSGSSIAFRWSPRTEADRYVVTILSMKGETLATIDVPADRTDALWPSTDLASRPVTLLWKVRALSNERVVGESRPSSFELAD